MKTYELEAEFDRVIKEAATADSNQRIVDRLEALKQTTLIAFGKRLLQRDRLEFHPLTRLG